MIKQLGEEGEQRVRNILKNQGFKVQQPDWIVFKDDKWCVIEVKHKERFKAPPFDGHGLDVSQVYLREKLLEATGMRTYMLVWEIPTNDFYGAWLDELEKGDKFTTKNQVRIYHIDNFKKLDFVYA